MNRAKGTSRATRAVRTCQHLALAAAALMMSIGWVEAQDTLRISGLEKPVEILRDPWGVSHIYARTERDLFFAQGFNAARDRLFQLEVWRRQATGTLSEILGAREVFRDHGTRLFQFRGNLQQELNHYHPRGASIIGAFVEGVNAYIDLTEGNPDLLPMEFALLGIRPQRWTPEVVVSRHQGLLGNISQELNLGRAVATVGSAVVRELSYFHPGDPFIDLDPAIDGSLLSEDILGLYDAFRDPVRFRPEDVQASARNDPQSFARLSSLLLAEEREASAAQREALGSNNWVIGGQLSQNGYPLMANDPHRTLAAPSLRYLVHLVAPGWNVIGAGEPAIPGISVGHNEHGAWGLTVFSTDSEDLYVYDTNPADGREYAYGGGWERMRIVHDTIHVRNAEPVVVELRYTRHGPVVFQDERHDKAYAVRAAWMEIGGAPYLASLRMDQARTWEEFREACNYSNIPGENMVWAGRSGDIGWQAVGIAPIRRNWSGLVPVPGDGRYEWDGYLPIKAKPHVLNPAAGYFATANSNLTAPDFPFRQEAIGWSWTDPYRWARIQEVVASGKRHSMMDMLSLQTDYLSIPARTLVPLLGPLRSAHPRTEVARESLLQWDHVLDSSSVEAGIYVAWERRIQANIVDLAVPTEARPYFSRLSMKRLIDWLMAPSGVFGPDPLAGRDSLLIRSLKEAVDGLEARFGSRMSDWKYGQSRYKHALIRHPLSPAVSDEVRRVLDVGPVPRGGNSYTVGNTGGGDNQTTGASFRIFVDTGDWDNTLGLNSPGQSGDPSSPHYRDLFSLWQEDRVFPMFFSRRKVESVTSEVLVLDPGD